MTKLKRVLQTILLAGTLFLLFGPIFVISARKVVHNSAVLDRTVTQNLTGVTPSVVRTPLSPASWNSGRYQDGTTRWFAEVFPFREPLIRTNNELDYLAFRKSPMQHDALIIGKGKQLFEDGYVHEYCGLDTEISPERLETSVKDMAELHARLKRRGVPFVVVITPSKASIYPESLPDTFLSYKANHPRPRMYDQFVPLLQREHIPFVDGHVITERAKANPGAPVFCRGGTHWSYVPVYLTLNSLADQLAEQRGAGIAHIISEGTDISYAPVGQDADLANLLNLIYPPTYYPTPQPRLKNDGTAPPLAHVTVIGGSFSERLVEVMDRCGICRSSDLYWYWTTQHQTYPGGLWKPGGYAPATFDWQKQIGRSDAVILEINEQVIGQTDPSHYRKFLKDALAHVSP